MLRATEESISALKWSGRAGAEIDNIDNIQQLHHPFGEDFWTEFLNLLKW